MRNQVAHISSIYKPLGNKPFHFLLDWALVSHSYLCIVLVILLVKKNSCRTSVSTVYLYSHTRINEFTTPEKLQCDACWFLTADFSYP